MLGAYYSGLLPLDRSAFHSPSVPRGPRALPLPLQPKAQHPLPGFWTVGQTSSSLLYREMWLETKKNRRTRRLLREAGAIQRQTHSRDTPTWLLPAAMSCDLRARFICRNCAECRTSVSPFWRPRSKRWTALRQSLLFGIRLNPNSEETSGSAKYT